MSQTAETTTIVAFLKAKFPEPWDPKIGKALSAAGADMKTWKDFAEAIVAALAKDERALTVTSSSTWAICQEYLGRLTKKTEQEYAKTRGGIWSLNERGAVTFREVIGAVKEAFPAK